jgi:hypothetical protein
LQNQLGAHGLFRAGWRRVRRISVDDIGSGVWQRHFLCGTCENRAKARRDGGRDYLRWYFTRPAVANAFAAEFGGTEIKASR